MGGYEGADVTSLSQVLPTVVDRYPFSSQFSPGLGRVRVLDTGLIDTDRYADPALLFGSRLFLSPYKSGLV